MSQLVLTLTLKSHLIFERIPHIKVINRILVSPLHVLFWQMVDISLFCNNTDLPWQGGPPTHLARGVIKRMTHQYTDVCWLGSNKCDKVSYYWQDTFLYWVFTKYQTLDKCDNKDVNVCIDLLVEQFWQQSAFALFVLGGIGKETLV